MNTNGIPGYDVKEISKGSESRLLNAILASTIVVVLAVVFVAGIPMWNVWKERQEAVAEYEASKRTNRANELREKSLLRAAKAKAERLEIMAKLKAKYPNQEFGK